VVVLPPRGIPPSVVLMANFNKSGYHMVYEVCFSAPPLPQIQPKFNVCLSLGEGGARKQKLWSASTGSMRIYGFSWSGGRRIRCVLACIR
jgi:hypothetical protein